MHIRLEGPIQRKMSILLRCIRDSLWQCKGAYGLKLRIRGILVASFTGRSRSRMYHRRCGPRNPTHVYMVDFQSPSEKTTVSFLRMHSRKRKSYKVLKL